MPNLTGPAKAAIFYALTLGLAVILAVFFASALSEAVAMVMMVTPAIAVVIMLLTTGEGGAGWLSLGVEKAGIGGWWLAIIGPMIILAGSYGVVIALGMATLVVPEISQPMADVASGMLLSLTMGLVLAFGEEVGWRGYMLPRLAIVGLLPAALVVGFAQGVWHLPLILLTPYYHSSGDPLIVVPLFLTTLTLAGVFYGYLRAASGSVWPVVIAHAVYNFVWNVGSEFIMAKSPDVMEYFAGESGLFVVLGLAIAMLAIVPRIASMRLRLIAGGPAPGPITVR